MFLVILGAVAIAAGACLTVFSVRNHAYIPALGFVNANEVLGVFLMIGGVTAFVCGLVEII